MIPTLYDADGRCMRRSLSKGRTVTKQFAQGIALISLAAALSLCWGSVNAQASALPDAKPRVIIVDPEGSGVVRRGDATFYPTGPIGQDDVVVILDDKGKIPGGASIAALREWIASGREGPAPSTSGEVVETRNRMVIPLAGCGGVSYAAAPYVWSREYSYCSSIAGATASTRVSYVFSVTDGSNQEASGLGQGWYQGYNGSQFGVWSAWYGLGIADGASNTGALVPWGNVWAVPKFKAMSTMLAGAFGYFYAS